MHTSMFVVWYVNISWILTINCLIDMINIFYWIKCIDKERDFVKRYLLHKINNVIDYLYIYTQSKYFWLYHNILFKIFFSLFMFISNLSTSWGEVTRPFTNKTSNFFFFFFNSHLRFESHFVRQIFLNIFLWVLFNVQRF